MIRNNVKPEKKCFARMLRNQSTPAEKVLWECLRRGNLGVKFTRQSIIRGYIADFYSAKVHLVIEVDGSSHDSRAAHDTQRDFALSEIGIKTLRFTNHETLRNTSEVVLKIRGEIQKRLTEKITPFHGPVPEEKKREWLRGRHNA